MNLAYAVKLTSGHYLADRIHHRSVTYSLAQAQLFPTEERARYIQQRVPEAAVIPVLLAEYEPPNE